LLALEVLESDDEPVFADSDLDDPELESEDDELPDAGVDEVDSLPLFEPPP